MVDVNDNHGEVNHGLHNLGSSDLVMTSPMEMISEFQSNFFGTPCTIPLFDHHDCTKSWFDENKAGRFH